MEEQRNSLEEKLTEMLQDVTLPNIQNVDQQCIYRVPVNTRNCYPRSYTPRVVSIGPYHHNADNGLKSKDND